MNEYIIPPVYTLIHIVVGFLGYTYFPCLVVAIMYQFVQYFLDIRFFAFGKTKIVKGNNVMHTSRKLAHHLLGFIIAVIVSS